MGTATIRIPEEQRDILKIIATLEKREMREIVSELIDEYIARHTESLDLLSRPHWVEAIKKGKAEVAEGVPGKGLDELED
jgi:predicted transcriptional regulator